MGFGIYLFNFPVFITLDLASFKHFRKLIHSLYLGIWNYVVQHNGTFPGQGKIDVIE